MKALLGHDLCDVRVEAGKDERQANFEVQINGFVRWIPNQRTGDEVVKWIYILLVLFIVFTHYEYESPPPPHIITTSLE